MRFFETLRLPFLVLVYFFVVGSAWGEEGEKGKSLSIEEAKFEMVKLYGEAKPPPRGLSVKYPELRAADKASRDAGREMTEAIKNHPQLKKQFDEMAASDLSAAEKMKLYGPIFKEAEGIAELQEFRNKYDQARMYALKLETDTLRKEGYEELADKMDAVLARVEKVEDAEKPAKGE